MGGGPSDALLSALAGSVEAPGIRVARVNNNAGPDGGALPGPSWRHACPGVDIDARPQTAAPPVTNERRIARHLKIVRQKYGQDRHLTRSIRTELKRCAKQRTFEMSLRRWAVLEQSILRGIAAGKTWREAIQPLALPDACLPAWSHGEIEARVVNRMGLKVFGQCGRSVPATLERLGIQHGREALEQLVVEHLGLKALRRTPSPALLAAQWGLGATGTEALGRLAATTLGVERMRAGESFEQVEASLGLSSFQGELLRRDFATHTGVQRMIEASKWPWPTCKRAGKPAALDDLGLCVEHQEYLRNVIARRFTW